MLGVDAFVFLLQKLVEFPDELVEDLRVFLGGDASAETVHFLYFFGGHRSVPLSCREGS